MIRDEQCHHDEPNMIGESTVSCDEILNVTSDNDENKNNEATERENDFFLPVKSSSLILEEPEPSINLLESKGIKRKCSIDGIDEV